MADSDFLRKIYSMLSTVVDGRNMALKVAPTIVKADALSSGFRITTFDYGDKTTWYQNATQVTGGELTINAAKSDQVGNNYVLNMPQPNAINIESRKLSAPHRYLRKYDDAMFIGGLLMADGSFKEHKDFYVKLFKDGIDITSHVSAIDYALGEVSTANIDFLDSSVITANYWHCPEVNASQFVLRPHEGVKWFMKHVEMQMSIGVTHMPTIVFEMWGGKEDYDYDFNDPMQRAYHVGYEMHYRSSVDYINVGNEGKGVIPAHDSLTTDTVVFPFNYDRALDVGTDATSKGKLIRIYSLDDRAYEGTDICTTSFYIEQTRNTL